MILDYRRLGKQRLEAKTILDILLNRTDKKGWRNHPAVLMWRGYEETLKDYYNYMVFEWVQRGYNNTMKFEEVDLSKVHHPYWLTTEFCNAHKSNLLRKNKEYYSQFNWNVPDDLPYIWPTKG